MEKKDYKSLSGNRKIPLEKKKKFIEKYHRKITSKSRLRDLLQTRKDTESSVELLLDSIAQD